ncbi:MAG: restriction endonuclease subunit S [Flavobacterium sp.]|jgi:restriction endonuclease S subunit|uniref:restriction endonuclease subunit S n=1 Tax=Flavobacterium sp. TaxID=239 RepID=UPI0022C2BD06|nr:restriction endonuclease subunit S [Flavobacterium sp.]MCZ8330655.1 restriction endonuclease subunit S [Flavobacterium sp.]
MFLLKNLIQSDALFSGYSFREKIEHNPNGDVGILQMKDINDNYLNFDYQNIDKVNGFIFKDKFYLQKNDILFVSKGVNNYAIAIEDIDFKVVPSATFFVIRVDESIVVPEYLVWYINQRDAQNYLNEKKAGTYVPNLNKQDIMELPIKLPPLKTQKSIAKTAVLLNKEIEILDKIKTNRKELIQNQLLNLIKND